VVTGYNLRDFRARRGSDALSVLGDAADAVD
jgi:hypothetical protein